MMLDLLLHEVYGELKYHQVDENWKDIQAHVNGIISDLSVPTDNFTATTDPTPNDDESEGYHPLSRWYNTVSGTFWILIDGTAGAAVWVEKDEVVDNLGTAALANLGTSAGQVPTNADLGDGARLDEASVGEVRELAEGKIVTPRRMAASLAPQALVPVSGNASPGLEAHNWVLVMSGNLTLTSHVDWSAAAGRTITVDVIGDSATPRTLTIPNDFIGDQQRNLADITSTRGYLISLFLRADGKANIGINGYAL